jgi:hypothetical protein
MPGVNMPMSEKQDTLLDGEKQKGDIATTVRLDWRQGR